MPISGFRALGKLAISFERGSNVLIFIWTSKAICLYNLGRLGNAICALGYPMIIHNGETYGL